MKLSIEYCTVLHCSALTLTNIFVQLSLDITFHAIEMWCDNLPRLRKKLSPGTFPYKVAIKNHGMVLRLKEIRYCGIVTRGSLKTLTYYNLPKY